MSIGRTRGPRAAAVVEYLEKSDAPFARLDDIRVDDTHDVLDIVVEPELAQHRVVDIRDKEPIRIHFPVDDTEPPTIRSRRDDFPFDYVHTNYDADSDGLALCMWEQDWRNLRRRLSAQALVELIRAWFSRAAAGTLHQAGQLPEPLLPASAFTLIVPPERPAATWHVTSVHQYHGRLTIAVGDDRAPDRQDDPGFSVLTAEFPRQVAGALRKYPRSLEELRILALECGTDLVEAMRNRLGGGGPVVAGQRGVIICLTVPKTRHAGGAVEAWEVRGFLLPVAPDALGEALGLFARHPGTSELARLIRPEEPRGLEKLPLHYLNVCQRVDRHAARSYAGAQEHGDRRLVAVGAGAIGSNLVIGTLRAGLGSWTIIDHDVVLPHNTLRQFQGDWAVGHSKAGSLAAIASHVLAAGDDNAPIVADVLSPPAPEAIQIRDAMGRADMVVDCSASPAVLAHVSDSPDLKRAASVFFGPDGADLVVLAEDSDRRARLDEIEAQYLYAVATDGRLAGHFQAARSDFIRYANACQDLTRPVAPWKVQALSGIAGGQLVRILHRDEALAAIWRLDSETGGVSSVALSVSAVERHEVGKWRVTASRSVLNAIRQWRDRSAPAETGGILLGTVDLERRVLHVTGALPAPPDSVQQPTYFVRGEKNLAPQVGAIARASAGMVGYVGEWHSHPDGAALRPSGDDEKVFSHLERHIGPTGEPYMIGICGSAGTWLRVGCGGQMCGEATIEHE